MSKKAIQKKLDILREKISSLHKASDKLDKAVLASKKKYVSTKDKKNIEDLKKKMGI